MIALTTSLQTHMTERKKTSKFTIHSNSMAFQKSEQSATHTHTHTHNKKLQKSTTTKYTCKTVTTTPYVQDVSEPIMRVLNRAGVKVAMKPYRTIENIL